MIPAWLVAWSMLTIAAAKGLAAGVLIGFVLWPGYYSSVLARWLSRPPVRGSRFELLGARITMFLVVANKTAVTSWWPAAVAASTADARGLYAVVHALAELPAGGSTAIDIAGCRFTIKRFKR